ncbi:MAG: hypothetical protein COV99_02080 [Bacteroidetes bacterium CG12_big_fil_rev_8_21_14_0_65_60_17]|nr:MAG: hypothetical protein COV99_02080 [Bacteroidetes bacterium CG12_big_fil_rev_8_21_14_0_65_60_17]
MNTVEKRVWTGSLACFILAAGTGFFFRGIQFLGIPAEFPWPHGAIPLDMGHIRHAHTHVMYFGWVTPVVMLLMLPDPSRYRGLLTTLLVLALLAWAPFLLLGYKPLSIVLSTSTMLTWYVFGIRYMWDRRRGSIPLDGRCVRHLFDASLALLVVASTGAWGLGLTMAMGMDHSLAYDLSLHVFLDLFAEGWLMLAILAAMLRSARRAVPRRAFWMLVAGIPTLFLLGVVPERLPWEMRLVGSAGALMTAAGLLLVLLEVRGRLGQVWRLPVALMYVNAGVHAGLAIPAVASWGMAMGLRIPWLHLVLLGIVTTGLVAAVHDHFGSRYTRGWPMLQASIVLVLASLFLLTGLWPGSLVGEWTGPLVAGIALLPMAAMVRMFTAT